MTRAPDGFIRVRGAREHNLKNVDVEIPRDALVVFTGVSGSGKSSLAFGTLYAEAQRRYLESVSPYARRLFQQMTVPDVDAVDGLPPAVALQQQRGAPTTRSSVGSVTTLSNLLRMLYSRAGVYPRGQPILYAESFSPNTPEGACPRCHGLGRIHDATEQSMVPDDSLTIRERAIASWPPAWHGQNLRDIATTLGYDVDRPWRELPRKDRDWLLFTDEQPRVPVYAGFTPQEVRRALKRKDEPSYMGTFTGARRYVLQTFAQTESPLIKKRVSRYLVSTDCPSCNGKRLRPEALSVTFAGLDIAEISRLPLQRLASLIAPFAEHAEARGREAVGPPRESARHPAHRRGSQCPPRGAARPRFGIPHARAEHTDAVAGRTAAPAPGHPGAIESVRRCLRARRAVRRPAPVRHRSPAAGARSVEGGWQLDLRRRARSGRHPPRGLGDRPRPRCRCARRARPVQRSPRRSDQCREFGHQTVCVCTAGHVATHAAGTRWLAEADGGHQEQRQGT